MEDITMFNKKTLSALVATPLVLGIASVAQARTQDVVLYTTSATDIRVVPLVPGSIPNLNTGANLTLSAPCEDDLTQPARVIPLSNGDFLTIWWNSTNNNACYSRLKPDGNGSFTENHLGAWHGGATSNQWVPRSAADLNGDQKDDLVLFKRSPDSGMIQSFQYKVALGQADGSFDFTGTPTTFITNIWTPFVEIADADGDNQADIVFHSFRTGASHPTVLNMLKGQGDGTFALSPQHLLSTSQGQGSGVVVIANFDADSAPDVFLPPDDDVGDLGQAYIAFGQGAGQFGAIEDSIDFEPSSEGRTSDRFSASAEACDINLDGHMDLISLENWWNKTRTTKVYLGDGNGHFSEPGVELFSTPYSEVDRLTCLSIPTKNEPPIAAFSVPNCGNAPLTVKLQGAASSDPDGTIVDYAWKASDGQTASGSTTTMTFDNNGIYMITLKVRDNNGAINTVQHSVKVGNCGEENCQHAVYDTKTRRVTIPSIDIPLLDPWTGEPTGEIAVFTGGLKLLKGVDDFVILPNMFEFVEMASDYKDCHARYTYADGKFAKGGWLHIPFADVTSVIVLPPNRHVPGPVQVFEATLRQLAIDNDVFHLDNYKYIETLSPKQASCLDKVNCAHTKTQLNELVVRDEARADDLVVRDKAQPDNLAY
jgi:hypothetical protein